MVTVLQTIVYLILNKIEEATSVLCHHLLHTHRQQIHTETYRHRHTQKHTQTRTHTQTCTYTHTCRNTQTQTHTQAHKHTVLDPNVNNYQYNITLSNQQENENNEFTTTSLIYTTHRLNPDTSYKVFLKSQINDVASHPTPQVTIRTTMTTCSNFLHLFHLGLVRLCMPHCIILKFVICWVQVTQIPIQ